MYISVHVNLFVAMKWSIVCVPEPASGALHSHGMEKQIFFSQCGLSSPLLWETAASSEQHLRNLERYFFLYILIINGVSLF